MPRNPLIDDLGIPLPATRRANALDIEILPALAKAPMPDYTLVNFPKLPWTCPTCKAILESVEALLAHTHEPIQQPPQRRLPPPPWICPVCSARLGSAEAMIEHNHGPRGPFRRRD